jgi:uncharacterized protein (TIGR01244 family)
MKKLLWVLWLLPALSALADEPGSAVASLKADLDAVVEAGAVRPVDGVTSAGAPSPEALRVFSDSGYVAVIDLRGDAEKTGDEAEVVATLGMDYRALPVTGEDGISFDNARMLDRLIGAERGPVLVHCASGNRVGALLALRASLNGASDAEALAVGREAGLSTLEPVVRERLEAH